ncbi:MAG TPA: hypothetical protein PLM79_00320 [Syntrophobacteraceae bacterium]|nr:hypothetical protein [Syntrophobacteraceae bacterium]
MELNIEALRKERRPLWMTHLDVESYADFLGGGGDVHRDRHLPEWERFAGVEEEEDLEALRILLEGRYVAEDYIS